MDEPEIAPEEAHVTDKTVTKTDTPLKDYDARFDKLETRMDGFEGRIKSLFSDLSASLKPVVKEPEVTPPAIDPEKTADDRPKKKPGRRWL